MRLFRFGVIGALVGALVFTGGVSAAQTQKKPSTTGAQDVALANPNLKFVPDELLVRFKPGATAEARAAALAAHGATVKQSLAVPDVRLVKLPHGKDVHAAAAALGARPEVLYAEPNWIYHAAATPNDPRYGQLWGLNQASDADIDAPEAWDITTGTASTVVAVVDTGVAYDHNDLSANIWANPGEIADGLDNDGNGKIDDSRGWDFYDNDNDPRDLAGHGTHVSGTIGGRGNNAVGVTGVNWNVSIMPVRVLGPTGSGTNAQVTSGFAYAAAEGAKVVNASLGCAGCFSQSMKDAIDAAPNTLFVVAAGNDGDDNEAVPHYPCNYTSSNLICVAATTQTDALADFSDFGTTSVDLAAPGTDIMSTWLAYDTLFSDGFESATLSPVWTSDGTNNSWATSTARFTAGTRSGTDSPNGSYLANTDSWIRTTNATSFAARTGCEALYDMQLETQYGSDSLDIEAATSSAGPWTWINGWWGTTSGLFYNFDSDLSAFNGQASVYLRFRLRADAGAEFDGAWLDQVKIRCLSATYDADDFNAISGTSMATPHVAGVAGLIFAKNPTATVADVKAALLASGDPLASLSGKTVSGARLNAFNALSRFCGGKLVTIFGTPGNDSLVGTGGDDVIAGLGGQDTINGGGGNDRICGGSGNDSLRGAAGADSLNGDDGVDTLDYSSAPSAIGASMETHTAWGGEGSDSFTGMENLTGSGFADTVVADAGPNVLSGGDGNDTLRGGAGNDTLAGGNGFDIADYNGAGGSVTATLAGSATGGAGSDSLSGFESIVGSPFADTITGDGFANTLVGGAGNDTIWAGGGNDHLRGGPGADAIHGEVGIDALDYATSPTAVTVSLLAGTASGGGGADTFDGMEYIFGSPFGDILTGSNEHNRIDGIDGNDQIFGLAGGDALFGSAGVDTIDGGLDVDKCVSGEVLTSCETTS
jgi:subtilisin family serine protease